MCIISSNEPKYCACLYANNVLHMYNCIHEKAIKPSCILYLVSCNCLCSESSLKIQDGSYIRLYPESLIRDIILVQVALRFSTAYSPQKPDH